jgi:photosystem II stability/assembly factor-like uncharacterized protein
MLTNISNTIVQREDLFAFKLIKTLSIAVLITTLAHISSGQILQNVEDLSLRNLRFSGKQYGIGVGNKGRIIQTTNGGDYWKLIEPKLSLKENLLCAFISPTGTSYVGGDNGVVLKSIDYGETWSSISIPFEVPVTSIHFSGDSVGLAILELYRDSYLFRTSNGGITWEMQLKGSINEYFHDLEFVNENTGFFITGDKILKTTDRGKNWTQSQSVGYGYEFYDLDFITPMIGFYLKNSLLYKTIDGGATWTFISYITSVSILKDADLEFTSELVGYCGSNGRLFKTIDGGLTWKNAVNNNFDGYLPDTPFYFFDDQNGFFQNLGTRDFSKTNDGATTWTLVFGEPGNNYLQQSDEINSFLHVQSEKLLFSVDSDTLLWKSDNGGVFWHPQTIGTEDLNSVFFVNNEVGFLVGENGSYFKTNNRGNTWQKKYINTQQHLLKISFIDDWRGVITGREGTFFITTDGGESWKDVSIPLRAGTHAYGGGMISEKTLFAVVHRAPGDGITEGQGFYVTNDGGKTWLSRGLWFMPNVKDAHMSDSLNAVITDSYGRFLISKNQGSTWEYTNLTSTGTMMTSMHFPRNSDVGFTTGADGYLVRSADKGKTWSIHDKYIDFYGRGYEIVRMLNDSTGYVAADYSVGRISCDLSQKYLAGKFYNLCAGATEYYDVMPKSNVTNVQWTVVGGTIVSQNTENIQVKWNATGERSLTAKLSAKNCGTTKVLSQKIVMSNFSELTILNGERNACTGDQNYEVVNPQPSTTYTWQVSTGGNFRTIPDQHRVKIRWTNFGAQTLKLTSTNNMCSQTKVETFVIQVVGSPPTNVSKIIGENKVCATQLSYDYYLQPTAGVTYQWFVLGGNILTNTNSSITVKWGLTGPFRVLVTPKQACFTGISTAIDITVVNETDWFADGDGDGFGDPNVIQKACVKPEGFVANSLDCQDDDKLINPNTIWYRDADGDGYGDPLIIKKDCIKPSGFVSNSLDCQDNDRLINPNTIWYRDADGDGYGDLLTIKKDCIKPSGFVSNSLDCQDDNSQINPSTTWHRDADGDGYGDPFIILIQCKQPIGFILNGDDCDDADKALTPENNCIITGIDPINGKSSFEVFPNPCSRKCKVNDEVMVQSVDVIDVHGKHVSKIELERGWIDVSDFHEGVYIIRLKIADTMIFHRLVVIK